MDQDPGDQVLLLLTFVRVTASWVLPCVCAQSEATDGEYRSLNYWCSVM